MRGVVGARRLGIAEWATCSVKHWHRDSTSFVQALRVGGTYCFCSGVLSESWPFYRSLRIAWSLCSKIQAKLPLAWRKRKPLLIWNHAHKQMCFEVLMQCVYYADSLATLLKIMMCSPHLYNDECLLKFLLARLYPTGRVSEQDMTLIVNHENIAILVCKHIRPVISRKYIHICRNNMTALRWMYQNTDCIRKYTSMEEAAAFDNLDLVKLLHETRPDDYTRESSTTP